MEKENLSLQNYWLWLGFFYFKLIFSEIIGEFNRDDNLLKLISRRNIERWRFFCYQMTVKHFCELFFLKYLYRILSSHFYEYIFIYIRLLLIARIWIFSNIFQNGMSIVSITFCIYETCLLSHNTISYNMSSINHEIRLRAITGLPVPVQVQRRINYIHIHYCSKVWNYLIRWEYEFFNKKKSTNKTDDTPIFRTIVYTCYFIFI